MQWIAALYRVMNMSCVLKTRNVLCILKTSAVSCNAVILAQAIGDVDNRILCYADYKCANRNFSWNELNERVRIMQKLTFYSCQQ